MLQLEEMLQGTQVMQIHLYTWELTVVMHQQDTVVLI